MHFSADPTSPPTPAVRTKPVGRQQQQQQQQQQQVANPVPQPPAAPVPCEPVIITQPAPPCPKVAAAVVVKPTVCQWRFVRYESSSWEKEWASDIRELGMRVCPTLAGQHSKSVLLVETTLRWTRQAEPGSEKLTESLAQMFSRMVFKRTCSVDGVPDSSVMYGVQLIEPLIGSTRDPLSMCPSDPNTPAALLNISPGDLVQSKRHLLFAHSAPWVTIDGESLPSGDFKASELTQLQWSTGALPPWYIGHDFFGMDLGSSYYDAWGSDPSAYSSRFLVEGFGHRNIHFKRFIAYEHAHLDPPEVWNRVPDHLMGSYTMINHGVAVDGKFNPWNVLSMLAAPSDFVVIKLDIDTPSIEMPLMQQLLDDPIKQALVDEMTFEHHVDIPEMRPYWGAGLPGTLEDTYRIFTQMRQKGTRMHSWP